MTHYDRSLISERKRVSERKRAANRANAQKSTGPRTPQGKARSSRNALKHGLYSSPMTAVAPVSRTERESFQLIMAQLHDYFQPRGALEYLLVERLGLAYFRVLRASYVEAGAIQRLFGSSGQAQPETFPDHFRPILAYDSAAERTILRTLRELRLLRNAPPLPPEIEANRSHRDTHRMPSLREFYEMESITPPPPLVPEEDPYGTPDFPGSNPWSDQPPAQASPYAQSMNPTPDPLPSQARGSWNGKPPLSSISGDFDP